MRRLRDMTTVDPFGASVALNELLTQIIVGENKMSVTVNAFPPLQSMNSPRGWVLAIIVGIHAVFFWMFTGLGPRIVQAFDHRTTVIEVPIAVKPRVEPPRQPIDMERPIETRDIFVPKPDYPDFDTEHSTQAVQQVTSDPPPVSRDPQPAVNTPVIQQPAIDTRVPLSEPDYPASEVRQGHAGTVLLSVYVLENGRIGEVRIEQSSGFAKLDASAAREAKRWRLKPGTQDGRPVAMWKTIPITFRLNNLDM